MGSYTKCTGLANISSASSTQPGIQRYTVYHMPVVRILRTLLHLGSRKGSKGSWPNLPLKLITIVSSLRVVSQSSGDLVKCMHFGHISTLRNSKNQTSPRPRRILWWAYGSPTCTLVPMVAPPHHISIVTLRLWRSTWILFNNKPLMLVRYSETFIIIKSIRT